VERAGFADVVEVRVGAAIETLPTLSGPFDLVFIDADKRSNAEYLRWALDLSRPGTLIVADNVVRSGAVAALTATTRASSACAASSTSSPPSRG
jgi:predicted O-methyltransferase YrrM